MIGGFLLTGFNALHGRPTPAYIHPLSSGPGAIEITRTDSRTLVLRPEGGWLARPGEHLSARGSTPPWIHLNYLLQLLDRLVRDDSHPMSPGQRVVLTGMTIEVTSLTPDRRPAEARFHFDVPLEDASLRWLQWKDDGYMPFTPPPIGDTVRLPAPRMFVWTH
jgi:hypothetical protein